MPNTTPNLATPDHQTPTNETPIASTHPPSAVAVTQSQSDANDAPGFNVLLAAIDERHDDVFDDVLASQTPITQSPTQPIIAAATQSSP